MTMNKFLVSQLGAREHYAVPLAFHARQQLELFCSDFWANTFFRNVRKIPFCPRLLRNIAGRYHQELPSRLVASLPLSWTLNSRSLVSRYPLWSFHCQNGQNFAEEVNRIVRERNIDCTSVNFWGFSCAALESINYWKTQGGKSVLDQVDPLEVEYEIVREEYEKWPNWEDQNCLPAADYIQRVRCEWHEATQIVVNSEWSRLALVKQGVSCDKLRVIPLAYNGKKVQGAKNFTPPEAPLRVLYLGSVMLRKGIQYLIEAARHLKDDVEIRVCGKIQINKDKLSNLPRNIRFLGQISRLDTETYWQWVDVFILPTLSDGFAMTQLEAMAHGVPVITTDRCGDVVTHGIDGLLIPAGSSEAIAEALVYLAQNRHVLQEMSAAAVKKIKMFSISQYQANLGKL